MIITFSNGIAKIHGLYDERSFSQCKDYCTCGQTQEYLAHQAAEEKKKDDVFMADLNAAKKKYNLDDPASLPESEPPPFNGPPFAEAVVQSSRLQTCSMSPRCERYRCRRPHTRQPNSPRCICRVKPKQGRLQYAWLWSSSQIDSFWRKEKGNPGRHMSM